MTQISFRKPVMLWADDDDLDSELFDLAFKTYTDRFHLQQVDSAAGVLKYLEGCTEANYPSLIVLDINMPIMDGKKLLTVLKEDPSYRRIPVVMVSTSRSKEDHDFCERYGVLVLVKPDSMEGIEKMVNSLVSVL